MAISISIPPFRAAMSHPSGLAGREWVNWFYQCFQALVQNLAAIEGNTTAIGVNASGLATLGGTVDITITNLATLAARATADEALITALQTRATADEALITALTARVAALEAIFTSAITHTSPLAKLTGLGANGSATFTGGVLTAAVDPT
jgi:hypothetical protein